MITTLNIKNFILVKNISIEFKDGLNIITGETGAGKSTIIGSINLLLGKKANPSIIGKWEDKTTIQGIFTTNNPSVIKRLEQLDINHEDNELIIRRVVNTNGKSKAYINDTIVTNTILKQIGTHLIDLHGQHDHQSLLDPKKHIAFLDNFAKNTTMLSEYISNFSTYKDLSNQKEQMQNEAKTLNDNLEYLKFQNQELSEVSLDENEIEELVKQRNIFKNYSKFNSLITEIKYNLNEKDDCIISALQKVQNNIKDVLNFEESFKKFDTNVEDIISKTLELLEDINSSYSGSDFNSGHLDTIEEQLFNIDQLKRKYKRNIPELIEFHNEIKQKLQNFEDQDINLEEINNLINITLKTTSDLAKKISKNREKSAKKLEKTVENELKALSMETCDFLIKLEEIPLTNKGTDKAEFYISTNKGIAPQELAKIASGGEISRIMLALKTALAESDKIPTLIFDEIDANIGGKVSNIVGDKLKLLSEKKQIICITHMPQIASKGSIHFCVSKKVENENTLTEINELKNQERISELARMLGGEDLTSVTLKHAEEMLV